MDVLRISATELAQLIRDRQISVVEVVTACLQQIEYLNSQINAVVTLDRENALKKAQAADEALERGENWGVLHGVPVTIKDTLEVAGLPTTAGYLPTKDYVSKEDAPVVARLKAAGAIILGKTNLPTLAADYQCDNSIFGRTNNPHNGEYTPGGSSGGSAAAIAAGFSALELGSDFGGSIRVPAHFCGVSGLMPTDGRVSTQGHLPPLSRQPRYIRQMMRVGVLARCVTDLQLGFELISPTDGRPAPIPPSPKPISELSLAWTFGYANLPVSQDTRFCIQQLIEKLTTTGCKLTQTQPTDAAWLDILGDYSAVAFFELYASTNLRAILAGFLLGLKTEFTARTQTKFKQGTPLSSKPQKMLPPTVAKYKALLSDRDRTMSWMAEFMADYDAWLCPVAMTPAFPHCKFGEPIMIDGVKYPYLLACGAYTMPFNYTGNPVVVIPIGKTGSGLPIGIQIVGKRWQDEALLVVANQIEQAIN